VIVRHKRHRNSILQFDLGCAHQRPCLLFLLPRKLSEIWVLRRVPSQRAQVRQLSPAPLQLLSGFNSRP